jgi:hypothetical protein
MRASRRAARTGSSAGNALQVASRDITATETVNKLIYVAGEDFYTNTINANDGKRHGHTWNT